MYPVSKIPAALRGTYRSGDNSVGVRHVRAFLMQVLLLGFLKNFLRTANLTKNGQNALKMFINQATTLLREKWRFIVQQQLKDQVLWDSFHSMVPLQTMLDFDTLVEALQTIAENYYREMGVPVVTILQCDTIVDAVTVHFRNNKVFMCIFENHVWVFFRTDLKVANQMDRKLEILSNLPPQVVHSYAGIVARTAVTFSPESQPFVPVHLTRLLDAPVQSVHESSVPAQVLESLPESHPLMRRLDDTSVQVVREQPVSLPVPTVNDINVLVSAVVNDLFEEAFDKFIVKSAEAIDAENKAALSHILGEESDANALRKEVARQAFLAESDAFKDAFAALEVEELVNEVAEAKKSLFQNHAPDLRSLGKSVESRPFHPTVSVVDIPVESGTNSPASSATQLSADAIPGDAKSAAPFVAIHSRIPPLPGQHLTVPFFCANGESGPLSVVQEKDGADQSGNPLPDGEIQAHFTTFAQSPLQGVKDGALGAQQPLFSSIDLSRSVDVPKSFRSNSGITLSSGPSGTPPTHELSSMLLAASMPSSPQSAFTPADGSTLAQSSSKPLKNALTPPFKTDVVRQKMNSGGSHSSGIPIGNPPGNAQSIVDGSRNPPANLPSSQPNGKVGGHPVQVLARSVDPSGYSGSADHPKTPSSSKLGSNSSKVGTNPPASLLKVPKSFGKSRFVQMLKSKSSSQKERNGIDGSNPVAHSSDNPGSASTIPPLSQTVFLPAGRTGIGGSQGAQFQADRLVNAPPPAPSLRPELRSAATPAATRPNEKPPTLWGADIGGGEHNRVGTQFVELAFVMLKMKYSKALPDPLPTWTHPCVHCVPNLLARQACVA
jgi:hypothetical protein